MYRELLINFRGKKTSILIDSLFDNEDRIPCFVVGLSSHYHDKFTSEFRARYQLVLLDLYWTDASYEKGYIESLRLKDMANHIEEVREAVEDLLGDRYRKIVILGHSAYGFLCLEYAMSYKSHLYGIINVCTPPYFKEDKLQEIQTEYINSNFGPKSPGGANERWADYYQYKENFQKTIATSSINLEKEKFVRWYISMGPILWKERLFWQDQNKKATTLWNPWSICLVAPNQQKTVIVRDVNITTLNHYFRLATEVNYQSHLNKIPVPVLWFIGLFDARVSLYFFDEIQQDKKLMESGFELYYIDAGHWPMCEEGGLAFDRKAAQWLEKVCEWNVAYERSLSYQSRL